MSDFLNTRDGQRFLRNMDQLAEMSTRQAEAAEQIASALADLLAVVARREPPR